MFELQILTHNVLLPTAIATVGLGLVRAMAGRGDQGASDTGASPLVSTLCGLAATGALLSAFTMGNGWQWFAQESWLRIPLAALAVGLIASTPVQAWTDWVLRFGMLLVAAVLVFPRGEGWEDLQSEHTTWVLAMTASAWLAWYLLSRRNTREAAWLGLSWIACTVAAAVLTAQSFMRVTEPMLAVASILGCFSLGAWWFARREALVAAAGVALFGYVAIIANGQFNSFLGLSNRLSYLAMAGPAIVAAVSSPFVSPVRVADSEPAEEPLRWLPCWVTLAVALVTAATVIGWTLSVAGGGEEEW